MNSYLVLLRDEVDQGLESTICKNTDDLATLIAHLDADKFSIEKIEVVKKFQTEFKDFCKTDKNLEMGGSIND